MSPYYEDLDIPQGASYRFQIQLYTGEGSRRDLSSVAGIRGHINYSYHANDSDSINFFCAVAMPPTSGIINCTLTSEETESLERRRYLYDIEMDYSSRGNLVTERILEGKVIVDRSVNGNLNVKGV